MIWGGGWNGGETEAVGRANPMSDMNDAPTAQPLSDMRNG